MSRGVRLLHPSVMASYVARKLFELTHPNAPWLAPKAVSLLDRELTGEMVGLEWGSGRSTVWLGSRLARLVSVEHDPIWAKRVQEKLDQHDVSTVDLRLLPEPTDPAEQDARYWEPTPYVDVVDGFEDGELDLVLVDGLYRQHCVARALPKLKRGGILVVDQSHHLADLSDWKVPDAWELLYHSSLAYFDTTIWRRP